MSWKWSILTTKSKEDEDDIRKGFGLFVSTAKGRLVRRKMCSWLLIFVHLLLITHIDMEKET